MQSAKTHYFLKASKAREVIYVAEGVCTIRTREGWRNSLYQAGYASDIAQKDEQLLLALAELEHLGQFSGKMSFFFRI